MLVNISCSALGKQLQMKRLSTSSLVVKNNFDIFRGLKVTCLLLLEGRLCVCVTMLLTDYIRCFDYARETSSALTVLTAVL